MAARVASAYRRLWKEHPLLLVAAIAIGATLGWRGITPRRLWAAVRSHG